MRDRQSTLRRILDSGIVAVMRARSSEHLIGVADAIRAGGVDCIEVTMTTPSSASVRCSMQSPPEPPSWPAPSSSSHPP